MALPLNPDLPASYAVPGIYGYISLLGAGPAPLNRRTLFLGLKTSAGAWPADAPIRGNGEDDVTNGAGKGSELIRLFKAFNSQGALGAETWFCPIVLTGTAQTRLIKILAMPTADGHYGSQRGGILDLDTKTGALAAGLMSVWIAWYRFDVVIANGDTYATIAANLNAQIAAYADFLPCTATVSTDTVTLTLRHPTHAAASLADLPIIVSFSNNQVQMYVAAPPGIITLTAAADATPGVHSLSVTTQTVTYNPASAEAVNTSALNFTAAINAANAFPWAAAQAAATATITGIYQQDRVSNRQTVTTTDASQTVAGTWGVVSTVGNPNLTNALAAIGAQDAYGVWLLGQFGEATSLGTISTKVESLGNGVNCKGSMVVFASSQSLATAGAIPTAAVPALTASPRYVLGYAPAHPNQAYETAARLAARLVGTDYLPQNYAGMTLTTDSSVPYGVPHSAVAMSDADANAAMLSYYMTPVRANSQNQMTIVSGRTTAKPSATVDVRFAWWGTIRTVDFFRDDTRAYLGTLLKGKSLKVYGSPATSNCVTADAIVDLMKARLLYGESLDYFDGALRAMPFVAGAVNINAPARVDLKIPCAEPLPLEQISAYFEQLR